MDHGYYNLLSAGYRCTHVRLLWYSYFAAKIDIVHMACQKQFLVNTSITKYMYWHTVW